MGDQPIGGGQMIFMDPPDHTRLRSLVSRAFTPRRMAPARGPHPRARRRPARRRRSGRDSFDYVQDFGAILPSMVISSLLGVPDADRAHVHHLIDTLFHIEPGVGMINDVSFTARIELFELPAAASSSDRLTTPRDDMLTDLVDRRDHRAPTARSGACPPRRAPSSPSC